MVKLREEQKAELIKKEKERRRIVRLRQVRQQSAVHAKEIREVVSKKKQEIVEAIKAELHEEVLQKIEKMADVEDITPRNTSRKSMTPRTKKKLARRREVTSEDIRLAEQRNSQAMQRLLETKRREKQKKEEKLAKRRLAEQKANEIMRGSRVA